MGREIARVSPRSTPAPGSADSVVGPFKLLDGNRYRSRVYGIAYRLFR
jgi:hypothetical protein